MGMKPWPRPLTQEEFNKAVESGAKTLFEIDPALGEWACNRLPFGLFSKKRRAKLDKKLF